MRWQRFITGTLGLALLGVWALGDGVDTDIRLTYSGVFEQEPGGLPVPRLPTPYYFTGAGGGYFLEPRTVVQLPTGIRFPIWPEYFLCNQAQYESSLRYALSTCDFQGAFATEAELRSTFPTGSYRIDLLEDQAAQVWTTMMFPVTAGELPLPPHLLNLAGLQQIDRRQPIEFEWLAFPALPGPQRMRDIGLYLIATNVWRDGFPYPIAQVIDGVGKAADPGHGLSPEITHYSLEFPNGNFDLMPNGTYIGLLVFSQSTGFEWNPRGFSLTTWNTAATFFPVTVAPALPPEISSVSWVRLGEEWGLSFMLRWADNVPCDIQTSVDGIHWRFDREVVTPRSELIAVTITGPESEMAFFVRAVPDPKYLGPRNGSARSGSSRD